MANNDATITVVPPDWYPGLQGLPDVFTFFSEDERVLQPSDVTVLVEQVDGEWKISKLTIDLSRLEEDEELVVVEGRFEDDLFDEEEDVPPPPPPRIEDIEELPTTQLHLELPRQKIAIDVPYDAATGLPDVLDESVRKLRNDYYVYEQNDKEYHLERDESGDWQITKFQQEENQPNLTFVDEDEPKQTELVEQAGVLPPSAAASRVRVSFVSSRDEFDTDYDTIPDAQDQRKLGKRLGRRSERRKQKLLMREYLSDEQRDELKDLRRSVRKLDLSSAVDLISSQLEAGTSVEDFAAYDKKKFKELGYDPRGLFFGKKERQALKLLYKLTVDLQDKADGSDSDRHQFVAYLLQAIQSNTPLEQIVLAERLTGDERLEEAAVLENTDNLGEFFAALMGDINLDGELIAPPDPDDPRYESQWFNRGQRRYEKDWRNVDKALTMGAQIDEMYREAEHDLVLLYTSRGERLADAKAQAQTELLDNLKEVLLGQTTHPAGRLHSVDGTVADQIDQVDDYSDFIELIKRYPMILTTLQQLVIENGSEAGYMFVYGENYGAKMVELEALEQVDQIVSAEGDPKEIRQQLEEAL